MYFSNLPKTLFQVSPPGYGKPEEYVLMTDITRNIRFKKDVIDKIIDYNLYVMKESDRLEVVSEKLYGSPYYHWILMLLNDRYDYLKDFPLPADAFELYIEQKYGSAEIAKQIIIDLIDPEKRVSTTFVYGNKKSIISYDNNLKTNIIKFIDITTGEIVSSPDFALIPEIEAVYAYDYEVNINEAKRTIKVLDERMLNIVLKNFRDLAL